MSFSETVTTFACGGEQLVGVLHAPETPASTAVLIIVGGPQYRVGSHRQFVLLARHLAGSSIAVLRFDHSGMGDATGAQRTFEHIEPDVRAGIDELLRRVPGVRQVVLLGLCDAASAALMYAHRDPRIAGLVLLNPWVRSEQTLAKTHLRHYYVQRVLDWDLWRDVLLGRLALGRRIRELMNAARSARGGVSVADSSRPFLERMLLGLRRLRVPLLLIISGRDLTAAEFVDLVTSNQDWREALGRVAITRRDVPDADHTFSRRVWRDEVSQVTLAWVRSL